MEHLEKLVEFIFGAGLFFNTILFIPQAIKIMKQKDVRELSLLTFSGFNIIQLATALHGFFHGDYLLAFGALASFLTCGLNTILILIYR